MRVNSNGQGWRVGLLGRVGFKPRDLGNDRGYRVAFLQVMQGRMGVEGGRRRAEQSPAPTTEAGSWRVTVGEGSGRRGHAGRR